MDDTCLASRIERVGETREEKKKKKEKKEIQEGVQHQYQNRTKTQQDQVNVAQECNL
jgi:DNA recombination-dependent growth factor C